MQRLNVVKTWYQNDFGRYGRRDERLARALARDPRVARVFHLEPPLPADRCDPARATGIRDVAKDGAGELFLFTPTSGGTTDPWREVLEQTARFDGGGGCAFGTVGDYLRFGQMLVNGGVIEGNRILSPKTVAVMTSDHLGPDIRNNVALIEPVRILQSEHQVADTKDCGNGDRVEEGSHGFSDASGASSASSGSRRCPRWR